MEPVRRNWFLLALSSGLLFALLLLIIQFDADDFVRIDTFATNLIRPLQTWNGVSLFLALTELCNPSGVVVIALGFWYFIRHQKDLVLRFILLLSGESLSVYFVKMLIARARPDTLPWLSLLHSFSFPSGHAASAMALFGFIGILAYIHSASKVERIASAVIPTLLILGVGASRIVLAEHYFSDVFAGYLLGLSWLALVFAIDVSFTKARSM